MAAGPKSGIWSQKATIYYRPLVIAGLTILLFGTILENKIPYSVIPETRWVVRNLVDVTGFRIYLRYPGKTIFPIFD